MIDATKPMVHDTFYDLINGRVFKLYFWSCFVEICCTNGHAARLARAAGTFGGAKAKDALSRDARRSHGQVPTEKLLVGPRVGLSFHLPARSSSSAEAWRQPLAYPKEHSTRPSHLVVGPGSGPNRSPSRFSLSLFRLFLRSFPVGISTGRRGVCNNLRGSFCGNFARISGDVDELGYQFRMFLDIRCR